MLHYQASSLLLLQGVHKIQQRSPVCCTPRQTLVPAQLCALTVVPGCAVGSSALSSHISRRSWGFLWEICSPCPLQGPLSMEGSSGIPFFPGWAQALTPSGKAAKPWVRPDSLILWNKTSPWLPLNHFLLTPVQIGAGELVCKC